MKEESEFILLTFSLVVVGESELFSIGDLAACGGCASNRQLALTLSPCRPEQMLRVSRSSSTINGHHSFKVKRSLNRPTP